MSASSDDRNLLFAVLAIQNDMLSKDQLIEGVQAWVEQKDQSLPKILVEKQFLSSYDLDLLELLVSRQIEKHSSLEKSILINDPTHLVETILKEVVSTGKDSKDHKQNSTRRTKHIDALSSTSRYEIIRKHAEGGLGEVFLARDRELNREVAIKEMKPKVSLFESNRLRFMLEAKVTGGLEHPGIVPVYSCGKNEEDSRPYYAMRFIRGETLRVAIRKFHQRTPGQYYANTFRQLIRRLIDVCNALAYAHSRGILHRDLKPSNIMLGNFGETLIVDWGLAKVLGSAEIASEPGALSFSPDLGSGSELSMAGVAIGTPSYMSPEQAQGNADNQHITSDIYSLGAILYVMLTDQPAFRVEELPETMQRIQVGDFPKPSEINATIPPTLEAICLKAMALRPRDRYSDSLAMASDLENWLADEAVTARRDEWTVRLFRWAKKHRVGVVSSVGILATAFIAITIATILIAQEQAKTIANLQKAEKVSSNALSLLNASDTHLAGFSNLDGTRTELLQLSTDVLRERAQRPERNIEDRVIAASIMKMTANSYRVLSNFVAAEPLYLDARQIVLELISEFPNRVSDRELLNMIEFEYASMLVTAGRLREAKSMILVVQERLQSSKEVPVSGIKLAHIYHLRAEISLRKGAYQESIDHCLNARRCFIPLMNLTGMGWLERPESQLLGSTMLAAPSLWERINPYDALVYAMTMEIHASALDELGRLDDALIQHAEVGRVTQMLFMKMVGGLTVRDLEAVRTGTRLSECQTMLRLISRGTSSASPMHERLGGNLNVAITILEALIPQLPKTPHLIQYNLAMGYRLRGEYLISRNQIAAAQSDLIRAEQLSRQLIQQANHVSRFHLGLAQTKLAQAQLQESKQQMDQAKRLRDQAKESAQEAKRLAPELMEIDQFLKQFEH
jgi:tetratricopeptide (TPR) repeat protein